MAQSGRDSGHFPRQQRRRIEGHIEQMPRRTYNSMSDVMKGVGEVA